MGDNKKWTRRAAVGSLASGGGLLLFGTGGSTQITSYRDVEVNAGKGEDAVLQFIDRSEGMSVETAGSAVVYEIKDNVGAFGKDDITVTASAGSEPVTAAVSNESSPFEVTVSCSGGASGLDGSYEVELTFEASTPDYTITATRMTEPVDFSCYNFGNENNYRDSGDQGQAIQPTDPRGVLSDPANVNNPDESYATAQAEGNNCGSGNSGGGSNSSTSNSRNSDGGINNSSDGSGSSGKGSSGPPSGRVGYALPSIQSDSEYELSVKYKNSTGSWNAYLVNGSGTKLDEELSVTGGENSSREKTLQFADDAFISNNTDDLYLVFETTGNGSCVSIDIDYFELRPAGNSN